MAADTVLREDRGGVRILTLNRPKALNALNHELGNRLKERLIEADADDSVKAVVITGQGRAFSAGGDLAMFADLYESKDPQKIEEFTDVDFPRSVMAFSKPLIAAVNGLAYGWGFTLPLTCDIRLAAEDAVFCCAFVRVGVTPEFGSSCLLPKIVGLGKALELVLTTREVDAGEAKEIGLVNYVYPTGELLDRAVTLAARMAELPAAALSLAKGLIKKGAESGYDEFLDHEIGVFKKAMAMPEHYEAVKKILDAAGK